MDCIDNAIVGYIRLRVCYILILFLNIIYVVNNFHDLYVNNKK